MSSPPLTMVYIDPAHPSDGVVRTSEIALIVSKVAERRQTIFHYFLRVKLSIVNFSRFYTTLSSRTKSCSGQLSYSMVRS